MKWSQLRVGLTVLLRPSRLLLLYMTAWLARALAEQGEYAAADAKLAEVQRHLQLSPLTRICALAVAGPLAARRGIDCTEALDEAMASWQAR